jgi:hypothetical protein
MSIQLPDPTPQKAVVFDMRRHKRFSTESLLSSQRTSPFLFHFLAPLANPRRLFRGIVLLHGFGIRKRENYDLVFVKEFVTTPHAASRAFRSQPKFPDAASPFGHRRSVRIPHDRHWNPEQVVIGQSQPRSNLREDRPFNERQQDVALKRMRRIRRLASTLHRTGSEPRARFHIRPARDPTE